MEIINTKYGTLKGLVTAEFYLGGTLHQCILNQANELATPYGVFIPQYTNDGVRRKYTKSLSFYPGGDLKSISLQEQTPVVTCAGIIPAELLTFYEEERIHRLFPLNGKLSGYWSEANEYALAQELEFDFPFAKFKRKIIGIQFYESGVVKSLTFWPKDSLIIQSPIGLVKIRIGFSLYPDGSLRSFEPLSPVPVDTPIGKIMAYNIDAIGIHGDTNSLSFTPDGQVQALVTSTDRITVTRRNGSQVVYQPDLKPSLFQEDIMDVIPLPVEFPNGKVRFHHRRIDEYDLEQYQFSVQTLPLTLRTSCAGCLGNGDESG